MAAEVVGENGKGMAMNELRVTFSIITCGISIVFPGQCSGGSTRHLLLHEPVSMRMNIKNPDVT